MREPVLPSMWSSLGIGLACSGLCWGAAVWRYPAPSVAEIRISAPERAPVAELARATTVASPAASMLAASENLAARKDADGHWLVQLPTSDTSTAIERLEEANRQLLHKLENWWSDQPESASTVDASAGRRRQLRLDLEDQQAIEQELLADSVAPGEIDTQQERVRTLEKLITEGRMQRLTQEQEVHMVSEAVRNNLDLTTLVARLTAGPVRDAVQHDVQLQDLRDQLTRLQRQWESETQIYGARHPRRVKLAQEMDIVRNSLHESCQPDKSADKPADNTVQLTSGTTETPPAATPGNTGLIDELREIVASRERVDAEIQTQLKLETEQLFALRERETELAETRQKVRQLSQELDKLDQPAKSAKNSAPSIAVLGPARLEHRLLSPQHITWGMAALGLGTMLGFVLGLFRRHRAIVSQLYAQHAITPHERAYDVDTQSPGTTLSLAQRRVQRTRQLRRNRD